MKLINIETITRAAEERGFKVKMFRSLGDAYTGLSAEIDFPEHDDRRGGWHNGCQYSGADAIISDGPDIGYGYNGFFYGPWHVGHVRSDNFGLEKLLAHPAMLGVAI